MWKNIGMVAAEFFHLRKISKERNTRIQVIGEEYINKYKNNGVIFVSGHFANWEIIPLILRNYRDNVGGIYRHSNNFFVNNWVVRQRYKNTTPIQIRKGSSGAREMLNLLKEKGAIAMLVDQKLSSGVRVNFFGSDAMTSDGAASLAIKYNYPVIPMNVERTKGSNFKVSFHPEIKINKTSDKQNDIKIFTTEINKFLEKCITKKPEGWFWIHNRWDKKFNLN
jgi:KDO2-lipid IV(A) lauroyltransferase